MFITYFRSCLIVIRFRCFLLDQTFLLRKILNAVFLHSSIYSAEDLKYFLHQFLFNTFRNLLLCLSLSPLLFLSCAIPHLFLSLCHSSCIPLSSLYLTLYLPTSSICLASILFQFTLIYRRGCCINSTAAV